MLWSSFHPRPQLRRERILSLNELAWTLNGSPIRLPFPPQSALSGFSGTIGETLRYEADFILPEGFVGEDDTLLLHLDAADQRGQVWVDGGLVGRWDGGYLPTDLLLRGDQCQNGSHHLVIEVIDTLSHDYPYGKQHKKPHGMWYTPVSGIWQSVWLEVIPRTHAIRSYRLTPDLNGFSLTVDTDAPSFTLSFPLEDGPIALWVKGTRCRVDFGEIGAVPHLWTPEDPHLYSLTLATDTDQVESYFALRTMTIESVGGHRRFCLNGQPIFLHGVLDQGYYHDGIFLPKNPEEYEQDVLRMKELGFNLLRKHIKVEPAAFYYYCDLHGMLVLQDLVNSGGYNWLLDTALPNIGLQWRPDRLLPRWLSSRFFNQRQQRFLELAEQTLAHLYNYPCVVGYTIFNEGWGQFDADFAYQMCKKLDGSRFYDATSGWFAQRDSDTESLHVYFKTKALTGKRPHQVLFLSECGGYTRAVEGHIFAQKSYGYGKTDTEAALTEAIVKLYREMVIASIPNGLSGCIYTQVSDVEEEINGLYTYDREVCKVDKEQMKEIAELIRNA